MEYFCLVVFWCIQIYFLHLLCVDKLVTHLYVKKGYKTFNLHETLPYIINYIMRYQYLIFLLHKNCKYFSHFTRLCMLLLLKGKWWRTAWSKSLVISCVWFSYPVGNKYFDWKNGKSLGLGFLLLLHKV